MTELSLMAAINRLLRELTAGLRIRRARARERREYDAPYVICDDADYVIGPVNDLAYQLAKLQLERERELMGFLLAAVKEGVLTPAGLSRACDRLGIWQ